MPGRDEAPRPASNQRNRSVFANPYRGVSRWPQPRYYRSERSYGAFARNLRIPTAIDEKLITATFKHGLLTILLPKTAETRGQAIPIKIS